MENVELFLSNLSSAKCDLKRERLKEFQTKRHLATKSSGYKPVVLISVTFRGVPGLELISTRRGGLLSTTLDWGRDRGTVVSSLSV